MTHSGFFEFDRHTYRTGKCLGSVRSLRFRKWHSAFRVFGLILTSLCVLSTVAQADAPSVAEKGEFFEKRVRPLLAENCFECHGADVAESNLRLDSLAGMLKGGIRGTAVVRGEPEKSLIVHALRHSERLQMPPKRKLPAAEVEAVARWIKDGAVWPDSEPVTEAVAPNVADAAEFTEEQESFWAFQPPVDFPVPQDRDEAWVKSPLDAFVLQRLEATGLRPAPAADRRTLLRRVTFDLTGLPPTPEEMDAFLADDSPRAFERVVDRLLASPRYGERWGRHWLDVARYADSNGLDENLCHANAFRYRDYVIRAFNDDKPFDRFVQEQIAGDLLADPIANSADAQFDPIVATGFLVVGPKMLAEDDPVKLQMDIIDEQIDTIGKAFMGMSLGCARCHDHKFDPIPTANYYSLAGIFKSTHTMDSLKVVAQWHERPLATPQAVAARDEHRQKIAAVQEAAASLREQANDALVAEAHLHVGEYLVAAEAKRRLRSLMQNVQPIGGTFDGEPPEGVVLLEAEEFARGNVLRDTTNYGVGIGVLVNQGQQPNFVEYDIEVARAGYYQFEVRVAAANSRPCRLAINGDVVATDIADAVTGSWTPESQKWFVEGFFPLRAGKNTLRLEHPQYFPHIDKLLLAPASKGVTMQIEPVAAGGDLIPEFVAQWVEQFDQVANNPDSPLKAWVTQAAAAKSIAALKPLALEYAAALQRADVPLDVGAFRELVESEGGPFRIPKAIQSRYPKSTQQRLAELADEQRNLEGSLPEFPHAMAVRDVDSPQDVRVHFRGNHLTQGVVVPRRFLRIIAGEDQPPIVDGISGRLELARWLTSTENPLTARVIVNRVWHWHFGAGLVRTPDNFGRLGERPTHPELLDWLTVRFVESGWSIKKLHRLILLSSTWRMNGRLHERAAALDPENRLLWHMPRRRLQAEEVRDAILAACGTLDLTTAGPPLAIANRKYVTSTANVDPVVYAGRRRSVYLPVVRSAVYDVFTAFDFADPAVSSGTRQSTTVASQALFMMNSEFVSDQSLAAARRLMDGHWADDSARVAELYLRILSRRPTAAELSRAVRFVAAQKVRIAASKVDTSVEAELRAWQSLVRALLASNEFIYVE